VEMIRDDAAVAAVYGHPRAARIAAICLSSLTHRGGGAGGVVATRLEGFNARYERSVSFLTEDSGLDTLLGTVAVGQLHRGQEPRDAEAVWFNVMDAPRMPSAGYSAIGRWALRWWVRSPISRSSA
jgi:glutamine phosphoribosylpyrophosphate amidotransferase